MKIDAKYSLGFASHIAYFISGLHFLLCIFSVYRFIDVNARYRYHERIDRINMKTAVYNHMFIFAYSRCIWISHTHTYTYTYIYIYTHR